MTLRGLIDEVIVLLSPKFAAEAAFEGRQLTQEALNLTLAQIMSQPDREVDDADVTRVRTWATARLKGQPLAYLAGRRGFYKNDFIVAPGVLIPRPETELVVECALRRADARTEPVRQIADLGCGSGCIGLSLLAELGVPELSAVDASDVAFRITAENARALGFESRVRVDLGRVESWRPPHAFDLIVANPPYIPDGDPRVDENVRAFEPAMALFAGRDGLRYLRSWAAWAFAHLSFGGIYVCEFGIHQGASVRQIFTTLGFKNIEVERDLAGIERVITGQRE